MAGLGGRPPFFISILQNKESGERLLEPNPAGLASFFPRRTTGGEAMQGALRRVRVVVPAPQTTVRIAFVGESTVEGFPHPRNLTASAFLEAMLNEAAPAGTTFEVVNLGVTAVASYPIRALAEEALRELDIDALVVHGAHNEFFGAGGVASFQFAGSSAASLRWRERLRGLALYQGMDRLAGMFRGEPGRLKGQLIEQMAGTSGVEPGGALHEAARGTLRENWQAVLEAARARGVPVVFCTVSSNERGMRPLASWEEGLADNVRSAIAELTGDESPEVLAPLLESAPRHAGLRHHHAQALEGAGADEAAREEYALARDLDALPWRAPRAMNEVIRSVAAEEGAALADADAAVRAHSELAPGWELFDDHVHPSLLGQYLLARTVFDALRGGSGMPPANAPVRGFEELRDGLGWHEFERYRVLSMMETLYTRPPMSLNNEDVPAMLRLEREAIMLRAPDWALEAAGRWSAACERSGRALPITFFLHARALRHRRYAECARLSTALLGNSEPRSPERCAAQFLHLLARSFTERDNAAFRALAVETEAEVFFVAKMPGQPNALVAYLLGAHAVLRGDGRAAQQNFEEVAALEADTLPEEIALLDELPPPQTLAGALQQAARLYHGGAP